ncbi:MAG: hypothetical protein RMN25_09980 [Anaerolineae bacterium]|nr:hypothetical protein [Thermoflexales bacterium]MDW8408097.1 hypothetical protein [Anaerolineae bacterium]
MTVLPVVTHALLVVIAATVGFVWGLSEIVAAFKTETGRALRTGGAWLLIFVNSVAAGGVYLFAATAVTGLDNWHSAVLIGLSWPIILRNLNIKVAQPIQPPQAPEEAHAREAAAIRFEQMYAGFQDLARQLINASLTRQRMALVNKAIELDLAALEKQARLLIATAPLQGGAEATQYVDQVLQRPDVEDIKKALLAAFIMNNFSRSALEDWVAQHKSQKRKASIP